MDRGMVSELCMTLREALHGWYSECPGPRSVAGMRAYLRAYALLLEHGYDPNEGCWNPDGEEVPQEPITETMMDELAAEFGLEALDGQPWKLMEGRNG